MQRGALYATLTKAALHRRLSQTLRLLLLAGAALPVWLLALFVADNLCNLPPGLRTLLAAGSLLTLLAGIARLYWRYWHKPADPARMAVYLEQRYGIQDNRLVNAVHFDRDPNVPVYLKEVFTQSAEASCRTMRLRRIWQHAQLKPALTLCVAGLLLFLAYVLPFAPHAKNAWQRFLDPATSVMPLNCTQFAIEPGDAEVIEGASCLVRVTAVKFGRPVAGLDILVKDGSSSLLYPMRSSADGFVFELRDLSDDTRYAVKNGNDTSRWHTLSVIRRPRLENLTVTVTPPAYTGVQPFLLSPSKREASILKDSHVSIRSGASAKQVVTFYRNATPAGPQAGVPQANVRGRSGQTAQSAEPGLLAFDMTADTEVSLDVKDSRGLVHTGVWQCRFKLVADAPPEVRLLNRVLNVQAGAGQSIPLSIEESDDYGLTALEVFTVRNQEEQVLKRIDYREIKRTRNEACVIPVSESVFARNASYKLWVRTFDNHQPPQPGTVPTPLTLHVADLSKALAAGAPNDPYVRLFTALTEALDQQKELRDWIASRIELDRKERISHVLLKRQDAIHGRIVLGATLADDLFGRKKIKKGLFDNINALRTTLSEPLIKQIPLVATLDDERRKAGLNDIVFKQNDIVTALQRILGAISTDKALADLKQQRIADEDQDQKLLEKFQSLKKDLSAFKEEQRKIMDGLEAIDKKEPEDWTDAEEKLLGDLAAKQQDFAKFFQAAFNDLSKVENQDFSNSTMADELIEMIEELQKSGAALEKKHIEIATVNEELLGQQADSIEANLERWLSDAKDYIKWNGEEGGVYPDVPLQDLPEELTDIIGDLIDDVSDMADVEDSTGSSLSAMDDGLGWGVADGNMDNMSARGITGNVMPNNNEVGGRSGEGRSGKSTGQFVEKEATGKGGRDTPTRLVQSPFEKGTVIDRSKDPQGGATGGGKQSGVGGDGLRGITPDQKTDVQQRLPGQQAELKQKAEALLRELSVRNLPTGDLEDAVNKMEQIQKSRSAGQGLHVKQIQSALLSSLKDAQTVMNAHAAGGAEKTRASAKRIATIRHQSNEPTPDGYEESVDAYFRALAEPDPGE